MKTTLQNLLNWDPTTELLEDSQGQTFVKSVRRSDNGALIGVVGHERTVLPNRTFVENIVDLCNAFNVNSDSVKVYEIGNGASFRFSLPIDPLSIGEDNEAEIRISASHDSTVRRTAYLFVERLICSNGMRAFTKELGTFAKFSKNHELNWASRSPVILASLNRQKQEFEALYKSLREKTVGPQKLTAVLKRVVPGNGKRSGNVRNHIADLFNAGKGNKGRTGADLLNGLTEYLNHGRSYKETQGTSRAENRFLGIERINFDELANVILK